MILSCDELYVRSVPSTTGKADGNRSRFLQAPLVLEGHTLQIVRGSIVENLVSRVGAAKALVTEVILAIDSSLRQKL